MAPRASQTSGCAQPELLEEAGDLLHLLAGRREHVVMAALVEAEQHGRELDQLARRAEDDEDHRAAAPRSSSNAPRHMPAPCAAAYSGVTVASTLTLAVENGRPSAP